MNIKQLFKYKPPKSYNFTLTPPTQTNPTTQDSNKNITNDISLNLKYIKSQYNTKINSDIMIREFSLTAKKHKLQSIVTIY